MTSTTLLKQVKIFDVETGTSADKPCDILIQNGFITTIADEIAEFGVCNTIDCSGSLATCGWVDAHTHFVLGAEGFDIMRTFPPDGVTYAVDAGTHGPANYESIHRKIGAVPMPLKSYLYIARNGTRIGGGELLKLDNIDREAFRVVYEKYRDEIIGVKIRIDPRVNCDPIKTLKIAQEMASELNLPLIVHPSRCQSALEEILDVLKVGDVYAHTYASLAPCILDENQNVKKCVQRARERGIYFDLSHGLSNFSYATAKNAIEQGFIVDTISTDLHNANAKGPVFSLATTMSKMLHCGLSLADVLYRVTVSPTKMLGIMDKQTKIAEKQIADITVFDVASGEFFLSDSTKTIECCHKLITPKVTVLGATLHYPRSDVYYTSEY